MRKIKRKKNYNLYILVACVGVLSVMGIGYSYLQETLSINLGLSKKDQGIDITDDVVTTGDGLYEDQYESGRYIYRGSNPDNYIKFNNELWRIVAKEADGTYKIIRNELLPQNENYTTMVYDERNHRTTEKNTYCTNPSQGCGVFAAVSGTFQTPDGKYSGTVTEDSSMKEYLNNTYYPTLTEIAKAQMQSHAFNIGSVQILEMNGNDNIKKNIGGEKMYKWTGNVGLVNVSDLLRASTNITCTSATDEYNAVMGGTLRETCGSYLTTMSPINENIGGIGYWAMNAFSVESGDKSAYAWTVSFIRGVGMFVYGDARNDDHYGARPVVFLKSSTQFIGGTGTESDPYIIKE